MAIFVIAAYFTIMSICAFIWPGTVLAVLTCFYGFEQWAQANSFFFASHSQVMNYLSAIVVLIGVASAVMKGDRPLRAWPNVAWVVFGFYIYFAFTWVWSQDQAWTVVLIRHQLPYVFVFTLLTPLVLNKEADFKHAVYATCIVGAVLLLLLTFGTQVREGGRSVLLQEGVVDRYGTDRRQASSLTLATIAASVIFASIVPFFKGASRPLWLARVITLPLGLAIIFRSDSRGQLVALILVLAAIMPLRWPRLNLRTVIGIPLTAAIIVFLMTWAVHFSENAERRWDVSTFGNAYTSTRTVMCAEVLDEWVRSSPWNLVFGLGLGASWKIIGIYPHVIPVQVLVEGGLVGEIIYLAILAVLARSVFWMFFRSKVSLMTRGLICFTVAIGAFSWILSLKQGGISGMHPEMMSYVIIGRMEMIIRRDLIKQKHQQIREFAKRIGWVQSQQHRPELAPT